MVQQRQPRQRLSRLDPSRTVGLRNLFRSYLIKQLNRLLVKVYELVVTEDAFGLTHHSSGIPTAQLLRVNTAGEPIAKRLGSNSTQSRRLCRRPTADTSLGNGSQAIPPATWPVASPPLLLNQRFAFTSTSQQVQAFERWLEEQMTEMLATGMSQQALEQYIAQGYRRGLGRAYNDLVNRRNHTSQQQGYVGSQQDFLRSSFGRPVSVETVKLLVSRVFTELKGVTQSMATAMTRTLADGLVAGQSPRTIARALARNVNGIGKVRASTIARTEIVRAHAEGQLVGMEQLGATEVGVEVEWLTAGDYRVCLLCADMEGKVFPIKEAHNQLPRHPNCRCAWIPSLAKSGKQKRR